MNKYFDEIPHTVWGLNFYINAANKAIKKHEGDTEKLKICLAKAQEKLRIIKNEQIAMG